MALKSLMLRKKIDGMNKELEALRTQAEGFTTREAELETALNEAQTEDEIRTCEEAVDTLEGEKETIRTKISELEEAIRSEEAKLEELENEQIPEAEEREGETPMEERHATPEVEVRAFNDYIRGRETRDDYNMQKGNNGDVIPKTIAQQIITKVENLAPIWAKSTRFNVKGTLEVPYYPASSSHVISAAFAAEFADLTASSGDFDSVTLTGHVAGALAKISKSLVNNADIDVTGFVVDQMGAAFASFYEDKCINGGTLSSSTTVTGILAGVTNEVTATYKSSVTSDDLITLQDSIPQALQNGACWIMKPATLTAIRKLKDAENRYLLCPDYREGFGYTLLGKPVYLSDHMPAMGTTNNKAVLYGDLKCVGIKTVEDLEIEVLRERFATQHAIGVVGWTEFDCKVINAQGLAVLKMGSSDPT